MDEQRGEFEFWAQRHHGIYSIGSVDGVYSNQLVMNDWFVWQAAIASIVVELPYESFGVTDSEIKKALDKAGIKWTE